MRAKNFRTLAWNSINGKWGTLALISFIVCLVEGVLGGLSVIGIGAIALLLVSGPVCLSMTIISLKVVRCYNVEIDDILLGFKDFVNAFLLALLNALFTFLWSLLFIVPGIIKMYSYRMSFYILADNPHMDVNEARRRSIEMMNGNKWRLFCLDCSFIGWGILCLLTCGILTFWIQPYMQCSNAIFYQELLREQSAMYSSTPEQSVEAISECAQTDAQNTDVKPDQTDGDNEEK